MVSLGASCPLPLPLTDGGAKTKQGPGLSPVRGEASPASKEQRGPGLIQVVGLGWARKAEGGNNAGGG